MACLPARATIELLQEQPGTPDEIAARFGHDSWDAITAAVRRRAILNTCDLDAARAAIADDPAWATTDLTGWCDHKHGAAPLNYMAMLRFDAERLGITDDLTQTGAMARLLLDAGAPVDGNPGEDETPLMTAASYGDADVAQVLIDAGADLEALARPTAGGVPGGSALLHAAVFGMTAVLDALVAAGARRRSLVEAAAAGDLSGWPVDNADENERLLALIMAADHERLDVIDALLAAGTPIDATDPEWGRQPLRLATENGRAASIAHLLKRGADPSLAD